jgi:5-formyltetrahydrofolate cyclo-ligase
MISEQKQMLRQAIVRRFADFPRAQRTAASLKIAQHLREVIQRLERPGVLGFYPLASEPIWWLPAEHPSWSVAFPAIQDDSIRYYAVRQPQDFVLGQFGAQEPDPTMAIEVSPEDAGAVLVPGRAFDRQGARLGRGGGWYDRVLSQLPETCLRIGIAFEIQWVDKVPVDAHDRPVDWIITENGVHRVDSSRGESGPGCCESGRPP